jgi:muconolactone D-isomerase
MLFLVHMTVNIPPGTDPALIDSLRVKEKERALELQRSGKWLHLWRVAGRVENYSVLDVASHEELHEILTSLPLFPYIHAEATALCTHPSSLAANPG